jgi:hypothetical protein
MRPLFYGLALPLERMPLVAFLISTIVLVLPGCSRAAEPQAPAPEAAAEGTQLQEPDEDRTAPEPPAAARPPAPVVVDRERQEVRTPCRFVNPTRQLEVFACHFSGPTHETVVEFDATGEQLFEALKDIGCRPADHWNATSPVDFLRNQGDRVLVLVRWEREGVVHEYPAEAMLVEEGTDFPCFVRGFSFSAREPRRASGAAGAGPSEETNQGEAPAAARSPVPRAVEITLGAAQRERAIFSLLSHPTTLRGGGDARGGLATRALQPWSFPPLINPEVVRDLDRLVAEKTPAELIFRRLPSEEALVRYVRSIASLRRLDERLELYEKLEPVARQIDELKSAYEEVVQRIRSLLSRDPEPFHGDHRDELASSGEALRRRGQWLCARIQELYFSMYLLEEQHKLEKLESRPGFEPEILEIARTLVRDGLSFEPLLAGREREIAALALRDLIVREEAQAPELERRQRLERASLKDVLAQLEALGPGDSYLEKLHQEDRARYEINIRALESRRTLISCRIEELLGDLEGKPSRSEGRREARRLAAEQTLRVARLEDQHLQLRERERWAQNDRESEVPDRAAKAALELREIERERKQIEATLQAARKELERLEEAAGVGSRG